MKKLISNFTVILTFSAILLASCEKKTVPQTARKEAPSPADVTSPVENTQTDTSSPVETAQPQPATYGEKPRPDSIGDIVFAEGWYLPTIAELSNLWKNHESVTAACSLCGGDGFDEFGEGIYWSSSLFDNVRLAYVFVFKDGDWDYTHVSGFNKMCTLAIRDFTMK